ncbi:MAG: IS1182 family transposase [Acidobacteria bacterium]|nr:IS1182 family transposase [Acidobacteriota bacterium]
MKNFKPYNPDQLFLLPPSLREWLPDGHLALFISDVVDALDLRAFVSTYQEGDGRGQPAYHPAMMVKLLLYAYCTGNPSSRKIERRTYEDVAYRVLTANQHPDHDSIADFRRRHLQALAELFGQVLQLCQKAGLVKLGHVALDGTKVKANASKHKAMSYERMGEAEKRLQQEVERLLQQAEQTDAAEDEHYGKGRRGDELPEELARRESRLKKIQEAKRALEEEAKARAAEQAEVAKAKIEQRHRQEQETGKKAKGPWPQVPDPEQAVPEPKAQRNFTDPDSRIMKDGATKSFEQAYNAQAAVDSTAQIIVAAAVTQEANDKQQLVPMLEQVAENFGQMPSQVSADAGYFSAANVTDQRLDAVDLYVAPDRQKHGPAGDPVSEAGGTAESVQEQMREKIKAPQGRAIYSRRKAIVEPVFGQIKEVRGFRRFSFRGKVQVNAEWQLICLTHNLLKLFGAKVCLRGA